MEYSKVGLTLRAIRLKAGISQADVAARARVSQTTVSRIERGHLESIRLEMIESLAACLDAETRLEIRWRGPQLDRLLDARHVRLVGLVTKSLLGRGWSVEVEYSFNHFGDRGSVDVVAWRPDAQALLLVEVKTRIVDVQELLATMHRKRRVVPGLWAAERRCRPVALGSVLVILDATVHRDVVSKHSAVLEVSFPGRTRAVSRWLDQPESELRAIWFVRDSPATTRSGDFRGVSRLKRAIRPVPKPAR